VVSCFALLLLTTSQAVLNASAPAAMTDITRADDAAVALGIGGFEFGCVTTPGKRGAIQPRAPAAPLTPGEARRPMVVCERS
jgi:hypothetical protein